MYAAIISKWRTKKLEGSLGLYFSVFLIKVVGGHAVSSLWKSPALVP